MASTNQDNKSNNIDIQKMVEFVKKNARYFVAGALFVVLLLILVKFTGNGIGNADDNNVAVTETVVTEEAYEENAVPAVNELINSYFTAYASGDLVTLQTLATPITQNEQSYITLISQYIEQYQDINCYTKSGLDSNSYMVNVSLNVKFMGVETPAPGLYFFYVRTNDDGSLYIDNLYSEYNLSRQESALDTSIRNLITNFYNSDDVIELQNDIQQKYEAALSTDENLLNFNTYAPAALRTIFYNQSYDAMKDSEEEETGDLFVKLTQRQKEQMSEVYAQLNAACYGGKAYEVVKEATTTPAYKMWQEYCYPMVLFEYLEYIVDDAVKDYNYLEVN